MRLLGIIVFTLATATSAAAQQAELACITMRTERLPLDTRVSPLDSVTFEIAGGPVKICYSRPSARGRQVLGGELAPYDQVWRTGANEPTMIHTSIPLVIAGIEVGPGSYSLYTVPGKEEWQVIVNASITQWGHERLYTGDVAAQEIARAAVPAGATEDFVETFTIRSEPADDGATVILEWENTRVRVPVKPQG